MIRRRPVDARPKGVTGARPGRTDVGVAVVTVNTPRMKNALVIEQLVAGAADMIHDLIAPLFQQRLAHTPGNVLQHFIPTDALPFPFAALADALQWVANALGVGHLIKCRRTFGAIAATAAGMFGIALEAANLVGVFLDHSDQPAGGFAVKTDRRNDPTMLL